MNVVEVDFRKKIIEDSFRASKGDIEEIYFKLAEHVLATLYKANPFHSLFEGFSFDSPNAFFKACVSMWADSFKSRGICCFETADVALKKIIERNATVTLGLFCSVYFGGEAELLYAEFEEYLAYLYQHAVFDAENETQRIYNAELYATWCKQKGKRDDSPL